MAITTHHKKNVSNKRLFWKALRESWLEFSYSTSIQGIKYITDPEGKPFTRFIWLITVVVCFMSANALVATFYLDFISNPTRMNIETDHAALPELHFPTVTVCSANYLSYIKTKKFVRTLTLPDNITEEAAMSYILQTTGFRMRTEYNEEDLSKLQIIADMNRYTPQEFMSHLRANCDELLFRCRWDMTITDCRFLFQKSLSYSGSCCSFNINQTGVTYLKKHADIHGVRGGISFIVRPLQDDLAITSVYSNGLKLIIHTSEAFPNENSIEKLIPMNTETLVRIRPIEITCSDQVRQLTPEDRECLFPEERKLRFFSNYDDENCDFECQILNIVKRCKCIPYFFFKDHQIPTCNFTAISCLVENFELTTIRRGGPHYNCDCPANCQDLNYEVQTNAIPLFRTNFTLEPFYNNIRENDTVVHVYLSSQTFRRFRRDLLSNFIYLIANFGSTYSLFLGMSVVSIIEVFYYFGIVLKRNYKQMGEDRRKLPSYKRRLRKPTIVAWQAPTTTYFN